MASKPIHGANGECLGCTAPAALFLCARCQTELRAQLHDLAHGPKVNGHTTAGLLDACEDVVLRRTRLSTGGGHRKKGDEQPALFSPDEGKMLTDKKTGELVIDEVTGKPIPIPSRQENAARLLTSARNTLSTTIRDLCEARGVECPAIPDVGDMALWLAGNIHAIACDESAGKVRAEVDALTRSIERVVDKPVPMRELGYCPTELEPKKPCRTLLSAREDAIEVYCPKCRTTRSCDRMRAITRDEARRKYITWDELLKANASQPDGWRVPARTLQHWRSTRALKAKGYLRPDGSRKVTRHGDDDKPLYSWADVEELRADPVGTARRKVRARR